MRQLGYGLLNLLKPHEVVRLRLEMYREVLRWNMALDPVDFVERGEEPPSSGREARDVLAVIEAAYDSSRSGT